MGPLLPFLVQTKFKDCLQDKEVTKAIQILGEETREISLGEINESLGAKVKEGFFAFYFLRTGEK